MLYIERLGWGKASDSRHSRIFVSRSGETAAALLPLTHVIMDNQPFVHLHVHSQFSLLDGQASVKGLVDKAIKDGMSGIALTDHGAMFGIKEFYDYVSKKNAPLLGERKDLKKQISALEGQEARTTEEEARLDELRTQLAAAEARPLFKPILGCEVYCARRSRFKKEANVPNPYRPTQSIDNSGWHLVLLAKNLTGYKNLIKMVSRAWIDGYYYRPRIDKELLEEYHEGIIVSSACLGGEIPQHILNGNIEEAERSIEWFQGIFGEDFYLELQRHKTTNPLGNQETYELQQRVNAVLLELGQKHGVKVIATNDIHFLNEEDAEAHDRLICLSTGKDLNDPKRMRYSKQEWMKTRSEMYELFADVPQVLAATQEICDKVELYSIDHGPLMPDFPIPEGYEDDDDYLRHLTYEGARRKYGEEGLTEEVRERIDFELATIKGMGFPGYFLIVQDFIAAARDMGVFVGPGRGSAAGSAVAYCLGITDIDPIRYDLLFERFLNPDRISMPDIDVDFDDDGRADVLRWVTDKYGYERVAHIVTYGTMAAKSAIKDVARVQKLPLSESDRLTKLIPDKIPDKKGVSIADSIEYVEELKKASLSPDPLLHDTLKYAQMLEGNIRSTGVHACGIIIGKMDISDVVPLSTAEDKATGESMLVTQYEGSVIESTGLIKMDFLGLKTLSVIKEALLNIKKSRGLEIDIDRIPIDDAKTYQLYAEGKTVGTFQFESAGMQKYLRELEPSTFEDLIAMNALYRPGPMDYIPDFIDRKHGRKEITYDLPCMERYLKDTYGITVYQEQVMLLSREIADFTRGQSDELRKAMGKKLADKMAALKVKFLEGGTKNGHDKATLEKIWADWAKFASYAFNKSHATCYSWVAYQTAYLKANYPAEYMAGALSRNLSNITEIIKLMDECRAMGIKVLSPDVNESDFKFAVNQEGNIRFGLNAIKGVGSSAVEAIIREREEHGPFRDVYDFFERVPISVINKKTLESLIFAGGFDSFGYQRELYTAPLESNFRDDNFLSALVLYAQTLQSEQSRNESSLFGEDEEAMQLPRPTPPEHYVELSDLERLNRERELVGLYLSGNPLDPYRVLLECYCPVNALELNDLEAVGEGRTVSFGGMVSKVYNGFTKRGDPYARITIEDTFGSFDLALFSSNYVNFQQYCHKGLFIFVQGTVQRRRYGDELELSVSRISLLSEVIDTTMSAVHLEIDVRAVSQEVIEELSQFITNNPGEAMLSIRITDGTGRHDVQLSYDRNPIKPTPQLLDFCRASGIVMSVR